MKLAALTLLPLLLCTAAAQQSPAPNSITVPAIIDHNHVIIEGAVRLPDGSIQKVHVWVDNGNPDLSLSRRLATQLALAVTCNDRECSSPPPTELLVGNFAVPLTTIKEAKIPLRPVNAAAVLAPGMNVDINLPSSVLKAYDVLVDFPDHKFSIGAPGTLHFRGTSGKVQINAQNGLIEVPAKIENGKLNLALDIGSSTSFLSEDLFDKLAAAHPDWSRMTGPVASANMWGTDEETKWKLMRVDRVQYGPLFLTDVPFVALLAATRDFFQKRAGMPTAGSLGANALLNYRVGLDYAHSLVYFEVGRTYMFPDFDVVGLTLRPEDDGRFTILGVADYEGKPSVMTGPDGVQPGDQLLAVNGIPVTGSTMGEVWSMLRGLAGQEKKLTVARAGHQFTVSAKVQNFLPETPDESESKKKKK